MAARAKTLVAAAAPVLIGTGLASFRGAFRPLPALMALVGALLIQIATNLANDYYDFVRGADTAERVGPVRVTQAGLLAPAAVWRAMVGLIAAAVLVGSYLVWVGGWPILWVGVLSLVCAVAYTGGPFPLAYLGLGDLFVFVFFGLVAVTGTYWVQARELPPDALLAGVGVGALSTAILVVNNLRDLATDEAGGEAHARRADRALCHSCSIHPSAGRGHRSARGGSRAVRLANGHSCCGTRDCRGVCDASSHRVGPQ